MKIKYCLYLLLLITFQVDGQEFSDQKTMEFSAEGLEKIHLMNHRGKVRITGSGEDRIVLNVRRKLQCASQDRLDEAVKEISFDSMTEGGHLYLFIRHPDRVFQINLDGEGEYQSRNWTDRSQRDHFEIKDHFDLELSLPSHLALQAVNHEDLLEIDNVRGELNAGNHHDDLVIRGAAANVNARSHHGEVTVDFIKNPNDFLIAKSHHGDIRVNMQNPLSAEVSLKSHHGSFYTAFDWVPMPMQVVNTQTEKGTHYKVGSSTMVRIGGGQIKMEFKTHHGDVYITDAEQ